VNREARWLMLSLSGVSVTDRPVTRRKSVSFDGKAKVGALVQRARAFKKQKTAEEAAEEQVERL
jgi:hypothetical protein